MKNQENQKVYLLFCRRFGGDCYIFDVYKSKESAEKAMIERAKEYDLRLIDGIWGDDTRYLGIKEMEVKE